MAWNTLSDHLPSLVRTLRSLRAALMLSPTSCVRHSENLSPYPYSSFSFLVEVLNFFQASLRNCINCVNCDDHFIFISFSFHFHSSYIIFHISWTLIFFYGKLWTHNWPAPNNSGFIAQLVEYRTCVARSRVQTPLKSWIFFKASLHNCINCVHCDDHFFTFKEMFDNQWRNACKVCKCPTPDELTRWANAQRFYWKPIITLHTTAHMEFYSCKSLVWSIL